MGGIRAAVPEARILVVDDNSPDGTGRARRRALGRRRSCTARARPGLGPRLHGRLRPRAATTARTTWSRWTPTSPTTRPTCRGCSRPRSTGADLVLGSRYVRRRRDRELGPAAARASRSPAARTRAACSASRCATSPAASSASAPTTLRAIDAQTRRRAGLRVPGRADLARALARPRASSRCRSASASAGSANRRCPRRSRSRRRGAFRPCATGRGGGVRWRRTSDLPIHWCMKAEQLAVVQGWDDTRATLRRWNATPWRVLRAVGARLARWSPRRC